MKKIIIIAALLVSSSLMAMDGERLYKQHCLLCHGQNAEKTPGASAPLAGRDATRLVLELRAYRDQKERPGCYTKDKNSQIMDDSTYFMTEEHISALAKYISSLK